MADMPLLMYSHMDTIQHAVLHVWMLHAAGTAHTLQYVMT
jgi:hypothetical protein